MAPPFSEKTKMPWRKANSIILLQLQEPQHSVFPISFFILLGYCGSLILLFQQSNKEKATANLFVDFNKESF